MKQYIDFFKKQKTALDRACHSLLNSYRERAFECFRQWDFPSFPSEEYCHTNIAALLERRMTLDFFRKKINPHQVFCCNILHTMDCLQYFIVNGHYYESDEIREKLPFGVFSGSLNVFAHQYPNVFLKYYNQRAESAKNGLAAFNTMFVQDGYVLYVPENVILEKPIQLTHILCGEEDVLISRRILIILESNAQAKILVCDHTTDEQPTFSFTQISETYLAEKSVLDFYEIEESSKKTIRLTQHFVHQKAYSKYILHTVTLSNGVTRNNYAFDLDGEFAKVRLSGMVIADSQQKVDNFTSVCHNAPKCQSKELFKYLLDEESVGAFMGKIIVHRNASQTEAYQNNQNILSGNNCRMYSKPQLEIDTDDVKCSHGMSMGQLDEAALFYIRSRGIPEGEAQYLLKLAFMTDVLNGIQMEGLKERLQLLLKKRFRGELIKCRACV